MVDFFTQRTVEWVDGRVRMIDQTRLPGRLTFRVCRTQQEVAEAIRTMVVRGAPAIGVAAAMGLALAAVTSRARRREALLDELQRARGVLQATRPTAMNLYWALDRVMRAVPPSAGDVDMIRQGLIAEARRMADEDVEVNRRMGRLGADLLNDGDVVLTHCNAGALATVGYGTALGVVRAAVEQGKRLQVIASETRPQLQGARLTAYELQADGIPTAVIADTAVGHLLRQGMIQKVMVGSDRITRSGHVFNKIGTYQIAVLAARHGVPFYPVAPKSTFDLATPWTEVPIEERSMEEVVKVRGRRIAPRGVRIFNPAFDVTPPELVTAIVSDQGVIRPPPPYEEAIPQVLGARS